MSRSPGRLRTAVARTYPALRSRDYRLFVLGQSVSVSGTWMQKLAQAWLVLVLTDSGVVLGVVAACQQVPTLLLTTTGGGLADRFPKRRILIGTAIGGSVPAALIGLAVQLDAVRLWMVIAAALTQGVMDALEKPARLTLVNDIAPPDALANAVALNNIVQDSGKLVGPALGGLVISTLGLAPTFWLNAASYAPVVVALLLLRTHSVPVRHQLSSRTRLRDTLRYAASRPELTTALGLMAVAGLVAYNWNVLVPLLARGPFGGDAATVGLAFSCFGLGGVVGGLALSRFVVPHPTRQLVAAGAFAVAMAGVALAPGLVAGLALLAVLGAASVTFRSTSSSLVQLSVEPHMRGRVVSLYVLAMNGTTPVGGPLQGWVCEHWGPRTGFALGGAVTAMAALAARHWARRSHCPESAAATASLTGGRP